MAITITISIYVISAICGNFWGESGVNPGIWESLDEAGFQSLNHGYGLGQWTNTGGDTHGRLYRLQQWLISNGYSIDSGEGQLNYLIEEGTWYPNSKYPEFQTLEDFLTTDITDIDYLTRAYTRCWEGIPEASERTTYANNCLDYILAHYKEPLPESWISGNRFLSESERYNNVMLVWNQLTGGVTPPEPPEPPKPPEPPAPVTRKKGMPVYMMLKKY